MRPTIALTNPSRSRAALALQFWIDSADFGYSIVTALYQTPLSVLQATGPGTIMAGGKAFDPQKDIPDLSGKVILCTGGNTGLGKEALLRLAGHNPAHIWLAARNESKAQSAIADIKKLAPEVEISYLSLDLSSLSSVREAARAFNAASSRLDILMNNAGIMAVPAASTADGYEIQFGTNHVGHFLFTQLLMPTLLSTAKQPGADVRIINLSSFGHTAARSGVTLDQEKAKKQGPWGAYGNAKLANILHARELARRYGSEGITAVSLHPGVIKTALYEPNFPGAFWGFMFSVASPFFSTIEQGAKNQLWAATAPKKDIKNGEYYTPVGKLGGGTKWSRDMAMAGSLWDWSEKEMKEKGFLE